MDKNKKLTQRRLVTISDNLDHNGYLDREDAELLLQEVYRLRRINADLKRNKRKWKRSDPR